MLDFKKTKDFLLCFDSDGTVMDTMTIKHVRCFGPCFVNTLDIKEHVDEILEHWNYINLYSLTRGINRFQGFYEECKHIKETYGVDFDGLEEFEKWVKNTSEFSIKSIDKYMETCSNNALFIKAKEWSKDVNDSIRSLPPSDMFEGVKVTLAKAYEEADLLGVSSANKEAVNEEWTRLDLIKYFKEVACQDKGTKSNIIRDALVNGYDKKKVVMVGDAVGDYNAAKENGVYFFPIIPKYESKSWERLLNEGISKLVNNEFDEGYQKELLDEFYSYLS